jgi:hypothetical protein
MANIFLSVRTAQDTNEFHYCVTNSKLDTNENYYKFSVLQTDTSWNTFTVSYANANEPAIQGTAENYKTYKLKTSTYPVLPSIITFYQNGVSVGVLTFASNESIVTLTPKAPGYTMIVGVNPDVKNKTFESSSTAPVSFDKTQVQNFGVSLYQN